MSGERKSLFTLIGELPDVVTRLVQAEIARIRAELAYKAKNMAVGVALIIVAATISLYLIGTLIVAGIFALALIVPAWAAALLVAGVLLILIAGLVVGAIGAFRRAGQDAGLAAGLREDVDIVKGVGPYDR